jgi:hypothetical protein
VVRDFPFMPIFFTSYIPNRGIDITSAVRKIPREG